MSKIFQRFAIVAVISLLGLAAIECSPPIEHIEASPQKISLAAKATQQLAISLVPVYGTATNVTAQSTYKSSDETVATVSNGLITGVQPGSATITVSYTARAGGKAGATVTRTARVPVEVK